MVCDLAVVLLASPWFTRPFRYSRDASTFNIVPPALDIEEFKESAALASAGYATLADKLLVWFSSDHPLFHTVALCSSRLHNVSAQINDFAGAVAAWYASGVAFQGIQIAREDPPFEDANNYIAECLAEFSVAKHREFNAHSNNLSANYPDLACRVLGWEVEDECPPLWSLDMPSLELVN